MKTIDLKLLRFILSATDNSNFDNIDTVKSKVLKIIYRLIKQNEDNGRTGINSFDIDNEEENALVNLYFGENLNNKTISNIKNEYIIKSLLE